MSDSALVAETAERVFADHAARRPPDDDWPAALWTEVAELGFHRVMAPAEAGGFGGTCEDAVAILFPFGQFSLALPLADAMLADRLASEAGLPPADGPVGLATRIEGRGDSDHRFTGRLLGVAGGRHVRSVVAIVDGTLIRVRTADAAVTFGTNLAGEPRDDLAFVGAPVERGGEREHDGGWVLEAAALLRTAEIAGALQAALALTVAYAGERSQFGRKIGAFQAVQHQLAIFAEHVAAVHCAAMSAARAASMGDARFEIAAAKLRANMAIEAATAIAHQVHGAIGFTAEYALQRLTRRLWSWRGELGNDRHWASALGGMAAAAGPEGFWAELTRRSDAAGRVAGSP